MKLDAIKHQIKRTCGTKCHKSRDILTTKSSDCARQYDILIIKLIEEAIHDRNNISLITLYKISIVLGIRNDRFFE